ncbi:DUF4435 domain-containing protein [Empedobacter falsenii]|uniref:DUF4435 domain-containing protein n=1 Tax=Empedobacter falsenii TaxID=343874 RepID=A0ABY8V943_9FLAO|nr:DUF4435 domain-containing protein [Empedobacter falsenii]WIH98206.1 DUF4435 domain-containing protein [Empedobacter falsenii]
MDPKRLLSRTKDPISTFHKFVLSIGNNEDNCICFFEGRDSQYYYTRINHFKKNYNPIICGNKMNVIESNKKILRKYPDYNTLFFIDSDFDEKVELPNLYVTCGYSIENFYCSSEVISEILKNEFFLNSKFNK